MGDTRIGGGIEVRLRPTGLERLFSGGFLAVWVCGWAVGEALALWLLVHGLVKLLRGEWGEPGPALALGAFLLVWLTLWTIGGAAAIRELLRLFWAEDRLIAAPPGLHVVQRLGPLRSTVELRRDELLGLRLLPGMRTLVAETSRGSVELSTLGSAADREAAGRTIASELRIGWLESGEAPDRLSDALPEGWSDVVDLEGGIALVPDPATRRKQATFATVVAFGAGLIALALGHAAWSDPKLIPLAAMAAAAAAGLGWGALWLARGRREWRVGNGRLLLRRRFGSRVREVFEAVALELSVSSDGDGDDWYRLDALAPGSIRAGPRGRARGRRRVVQSIHDPDVPRRIGRWLAARAGVAFEDRATREQRAAEIADLRRQLDQSGRLGRLVGRWIDRADKDRRPAR